MPSTELPESKVTIAIYDHLSGGRLEEMLELPSRLPKVRAKLPGYVLKPAGVRGTMTATEGDGTLDVLLVDLTESQLGELDKNVGPAYERVTVTVKGGESAQLYKRK